MSDNNGLIEKFLNERELTKEQERVLVEQINRFNRILKMGKLDNLILKDALGDVFLKEDTIIHGTSYNEERLKKIASSGILTGQAVGIAEDGETFYCADFHRVYGDMPLRIYNDNYTYNDGRCPMGTKQYGQKQIAFVISPNPIINELLSYDCYKKDTFCGDITRSFVNVKGLPLDEGKGASILYGVPSNCFSGIILGDRIIEDKEKLDFIIKTFPWCYVCSRYGKIIYEPDIEYINSSQYTELRRKRCLDEIQIKNIEKEKEQVEKELRISELKFDKLLLSIINTVNINEAANILINMGWQGDIDSVVGYLNSFKINQDKKR